MKKTKIVGSVLLLGCFLFFSQMCDTDSKDLGSGFVYNAEHKHILGKIDIPPNVISYDYDKYFVVVKQKPTEFTDAIYDKTKYVYPLGRDTVYYWLIVKEEQKTKSYWSFGQYSIFETESKIQSSGQTYFKVIDHVQRGWH